MKIKINSISQINSNKVLTPKQIILKKEISKEISIYGTSKNSTTYFINYAERYRIGLLNSFEIQGINITSEFLKEYIRKGNPTDCLFCLVLNHEQKSAHRYF